MKRTFFVALFLCMISCSLHAQYKYEFTDVKRNPATSVKNQAATGTCWCFGTTSFIESEVIRLSGGKIGPEDIDLSEMYTVRCNYIERTKDNYLRNGKGNVGPGSITHMAINIMKKYGCVPEEVYHGICYHSPNGLHNHGNLSKWIKEISALAVEKHEGYPEKIYNALLDTYLGEYPANFTYKGKKYTPKTYFESLKINLDDYVEITSFTHHPFYERIPLEIPDNWDHQLMYNLPLDEFMAVIDNAINMGSTVAWDGDLTDTGYDFYKEISLNTSFDLKHTAQIEKRIVEDKVTQENRQYRFETFKLVDDHIEHIVGIAKDQEGVKYYITKNSWGAGKTSSQYNARNDSGYHYMSEEYVKGNTICYVVHKNCIPKAIRAKLGIK